MTTVSRLSVLRAAAQDALADNCGSSLPIIMKDEMIQVNEDKTPDGRGLRNHA